MLFKLPLLLVALIGSASASFEFEFQGDDVVYSPHGILKTNTQHNFYTAGKCSSQFKFRNNYLKTMPRNYRSFKQDNKDKETNIRTVFLDSQHLTTGDKSPQPMIYGKWYTWISDTKCTVSSPVDCGMPGLCLDNKKATDTFVDLMKNIFDEKFLRTDGHYCARNHGRDSLNDCCSGLVGKGGEYKLERSGWTLRRKDGTGAQHEMPYLFVKDANQGNQGKKSRLNIECRGDDIWFGDDETEPSLVVFSAQRIDSDEWIYRSPNGKDYENSRDIGSDFDGDMWEDSQMVFNL